MRFGKSGLRKVKELVRDGNPDLLRVVSMPTSEIKLWDGTEKLPDLQYLFIAVLLKYGELVIEHGLIDEAKKCELTTARSGGEVVLGFRHKPNEEWTPDPRDIYLEKMPELLGEPRMIIELTPLDATETI